MINGSPKKKKVSAKKKVVATKKMSAALAKKKKKPTVMTKNLKIVRSIPSGQRAMFSNDLAVQHEAATFTLLFFELQQPLIITDTEDGEEQFKALKEIEAECIARIVMPIPMMPKVIAALQENFQRHQAKVTGEVTLVNIMNS